jgi:hypothetical protein
MEVQIDESIIAETKRCHKDFKCLKGEQCYCQAESFASNKVLFVKVKGYPFCRYKLPFGFSYICRCPVRIEIFNKYNN